MRDRRGLDEIVVEPELSPFVANDRIDAFYRLPRRFGIGAHARHAMGLHVETIVRDIAGEQNRPGLAWPGFTKASAKAGAVQPVKVRPG